MIRLDRKRFFEKLTLVRKYWPPLLHDLACKSRWMNGRMDYVKFIILARSRVGSNFLRSALNSHSQIVLYGELFQRLEAIRWEIAGYSQSKRMLSRYRTNPVQFLKSQVFHPFPEPVRAVGFKLFYYHARKNELSPIWKHLAQNQEIKVIHLKRKNILRAHLSRQKAAITGVWIKKSGSSEQHVQIALDPDACVIDFNRTREWEREHDVVFGEHDKIEVLYEDLAGDFQGQMTRIQDFLGVCVEEVHARTYKQADQPLSEAISNYAALRARFAGTSWEEFFNDE